MKDWLISFGIVILIIALFAIDIVVAFLIPDIWLFVMVVALISASVVCIHHLLKI